MRESATAERTVSRRQQMNTLERPIVFNHVAPATPRVFALQRYAPLAVWVIVTLTLIFISLRIIGWGYLAAGDARRHVAKAFTEKPYTEIVVMRPDYSMDHSPGWEWLLRQVHRVTRWDSDALMSFSVVVGLLFVFLAPLPWVRRPEAWLAALLVETVTIPGLMGRFTQARPYLLTEGILIAILFSWSGENSEKPSRLKLALTCLAFALSAWIHGAWYLWVLPLIAFFMAAKWRSGLWLATCWIVGTIGGAILTGKPIEFLKQALLIAAAISHEQVPQWVLVGEFRPSYGEVFTLVVMLAVIVWRKQQDGACTNILRGPVFWLIAICWILGFKADRFWGDWGVPAALVWFTLEFQELMTDAWGATSWRRVMAGGLLAAPLFLHTTNDLERRYTTCLTEAFLDGSQPEMQGWMPEPKSIFYTADMRFFYNTFYKNPRAEWRYILGMEPALMPDADLQIFRRIQINNYSVSAYQPWVDKLQPGDRLEIDSLSQPTFPRLEWTNAATGIWIGRLPRGH
jgi:hypothetical protein